VGDRRRTVHRRGQDRDRGCVQSALGYTLTLGGATQPGIPGLFGESGWTPPTIGYRRAVDTYRIYDGTDEYGIVGKVAPGLFAQEGWCWRMVYENPIGHGTHCTQPVRWVGR
jgi:hypothetical protein